MKMKCSRCGYVWKYRGEAKEALCPICLHIVKTEAQWVEEAQEADG